MGIFVTLATKSFVTKLAHERLLSCVSPLMLKFCIFSLEMFCTEPTDQGLLWFIISFDLRITSYNNDGLHNFPLNCEVTNHFKWTSKVEWKMCFFSTFTNMYLLKTLQIYFFDFFKFLKICYYNFKKWKSMSAGKNLLFLSRACFWLTRTSVALQP